MNDPDPAPPEYVEQRPDGGDLLWEDREASNSPPKQERPKELDGGWEEGPTDEHGYRHFTAGPVTIRGFDGPDGFEPDGELVTTEPVMVHIERMDSGLWWLGLSWDGGGHVAIHFSAKKPIRVMWHDERG